MRTEVLLAVALAAKSYASWRDPAGFHDGSDLEHFVTRPDLTAPKYNVTNHQKFGHPTEGYFFLSPYSSLDHQTTPNGRKEHKTCQTGAHIYDSSGQLVWSGACKYDNRNVYGFRPTWINGSQYLSFHMDGDDLGDDVNKKSASIILNENYEETLDRIEDIDGGAIDFHEFNILSDGQTALVSTISQQGAEDDDIAGGEHTVVSCGFEEIDITTGSVKFQWDAVANGLKLSESWDMAVKNVEDGIWDPFHCNAIDRDDSGNYYLSARHTSTIYKISGEDGHIIWRLGGFTSDFEMTEDTKFQYQHHVRVRSQNATHTILTVFDNHGVEASTNAFKEAGTSVAKMIVLDTTSMTASTLRQFPRPDGKCSPKLGSVQLFDDDYESTPVLVDFAMDGYVAEYDSSNRLVSEAKFVSNRMSSYRAYKYPFTGRPLDPPVCKIMPVAFGEDGSSIASTFYVSWNGATEVAQWRFLGSGSEDGPFRTLATVDKTGFETAFSATRFVRHGYAEAIDSNGEVLARSVTVATPLGSHGAQMLEGLVQEETADNTVAQPEDAARPGQYPGVWYILSTLFLWSLALVGLYALGQHFFPTWFRFHRGYKPLDTLPG